MKHLTESLQQSEHADRLGVQEERHLQYHLAQSCVQEHTVTYSPQHPGLGSQGPSASFELQKAISATQGDIKSLEQLPHQQGQEKGGTRLRHSIYHFKFSCYFPLHRGGGR